MPFLWLQSDPPEGTAGFCAQRVPETLPSPAHWWRDAWAPSHRPLPLSQNNRNGPSHAGKKELPVTHLPFSHVKNANTMHDMTHNFLRHQSFVGITRPDITPLLYCSLFLYSGLPRRLSSRRSACSVRDVGSISGSGRSPGGGHGNSLQYSRLENPMDRGSWRATVRGVAKSQTRLSN